MNPKPVVVISKFDAQNVPVYDNGETAFFWLSPCIFYRDGKIYSSETELWALFDGPTTRERARNILAEGGWLENLPCEELSQEDTVGILMEITDIAAELRNQLNMVVWQYFIAEADKRAAMRAVKAFDAFTTGTLGDFIRPCQSVRKT